MQVSPIESLRLMCLLSITENGEVSGCAGQGGVAPGPSSLGAELTLVLPTGLIPKDYRSLKTQYLQVSVSGDSQQSKHCVGLGFPSLLLLTMRRWAAALPRDARAVSAGQPLPPRAPHKP